MDAVVEKPTKNDQKMAQRSLSVIDKLDRAITNKRRTVGIEINDDEVTHVEIPLAAFRFLKLILTNMAEGKAISLIPEESELSTQQAADILNVSRPHLVKLLESGRIPFKKVGSHRRIKLEEVKNYDEQLQKDREEALSELAKEAQELDLGY